MEVTATIRRMPDSSQKKASSAVRSASSLEKKAEVFDAFSALRTGFAAVALFAPALFSGNNLNAFVYFQF